MKKDISAAPLLKPLCLLNSKVAGGKDLWKRKTPIAVGIVYSGFDACG